MPVARDGKVTTRRPGINLGDIEIGASVRTLTQSQLANLAHWVRARGRVLVPLHLLPTTAANAWLPAGTVLRYKVRESGTAIARVWISPGRVYVETCAKSSGVTELTYTCVGSESSIGCWELPRAALARGGTDLGLALDSYGPRRPFFDATSEGPHALATLTAALSTKRGTLAAGWYEDTITITSGAFVDLLVAGTPVLPSKDKPTSTTRSCVFDVYAYVSAAATTGEIRIKDAAGATSSAITVSSTTPAWIGTISKSFLCEDLSTADGVPGGGQDTVQIQARRTAGAGSVRLKGWVLYE